MPPEEVEKEAKTQEIRQQLDEFMQKDIADIISYAANKLQQFYPSFTHQQKKSILTNSENSKVFLRADLYADYGFADKDPEAYVAQSVFNYKKRKTEKSEHFSLLRTNIRIRRLEIELNG